MQPFTKVSYINQTGNAIINAGIYTGAGNFSNGLAFIRSQDGLFGYIDKTNTVIIEPQFIEAADFSDGMAKVNIYEKSYYIPNNHKKRGYIDKTGEVVIETDFDRLYDFSEGLALAAKDDELFFIDKNGRKQFAFRKDEIQFEYRGNQKYSEGVIVACDARTQKCGFMDKSGKFVIEPIFNDAANFSEGLARVSIIENHREYLGFINHSGNFMIPPKFDLDSDFRRNSTDFSEGLASLIDAPSKMGREPTFMYIDKTGEIILQTDFFLAEQFQEGLAVVNDSRTGNYGFIDKSGKLVIPLRYYLANNFSEGLALVAY